MKQNLLRDGDTVWLLIHKGTYSEQSDSTARVSFFLERKGEDSPKYQFTATNLPIPKAQKLHIFAALVYTVKLQIGKVKFDGENFLPLPQQLITFTEKDCK